MRFSFSVAMYGMFHLIGGDKVKLGLGHVRIFLCILEHPRGGINLTISQKKKTPLFFLSIYFTIYFTKYLT